MGCGKSKHDVVTGNTTPLRKSSKAESTKGKGKETNSTDGASLLKKQESRKTNNIGDCQSQTPNSNNDNKLDCSEKKTESLSEDINKENGKNIDGSTTDKKVDEEILSAKETPEEEKAREKDVLEKNKNVNENVAVVEEEKPSETKEVDKNEKTDIETKEETMTIDENEDDTKITLPSTEQKEDEITSVTTEIVSDEPPVAKEGETPVPKDENKADVVEEKQVETSAKAEESKTA